MAVRLKFTDPAQPPEAQVYARPSAKLLRREVQEFVRGLRMPCLSGEAVTAGLVYVYSFERETFGLKPLTLKALQKLAAKQPDLAKSA